MTKDQFRDVDFFLAMDLYWNTFASIVDGNRVGRSVDLGSGGEARRLSVFELGICQLLTHQYQL